MHSASGRRRQAALEDAERRIARVRHAVATTRQAEPMCSPEEAWAARWQMETAVKATRAKSSSPRNEVKAFGRGHR
jgi:hypothetical protein